MYRTWIIIGRKRIFEKGAEFTSSYGVVNEGPEAGPVAPVDGGREVVHHRHAHKALCRVDDPDDGVGVLLAPRRAEGGRRAAEVGGEARPRYI